MKKGLTEIVFILDKSGSMSGLELDTIGGYNSFIERQKKEKGEAVISTILFNDISEVVHNRVLISNIKPMTDKDYFVGGCTALLDAIGGAINHIANVHRLEGKDNVPEKTIFVITTDGQENSSIEYNYESIKKMISNEQKKYGWEFLFLGANIDAVAEALKIGIREDHAVKYFCDGIGTRENFVCLSSAISGVRNGHEINSGWKKNIEKYEKKHRGKKSSKLFNNNEKKFSHNIFDHII